ncbi:MAG: hypothetical protein R2867_19725 [Caldilineaceae bacterium]
MTVDTLSERQAQQQASETTQSTASSDAGLCKAADYHLRVVVFHTPLWAIGLCPLLAIGLYFWPVTHVVERAI